MKAAKITAWLGFFAMTAGLVNGFINGDLFSDGAKLLDNPWGVMSLIDLYVGFALFSIWIVYREKKITIKLFWVVMMMIFGFFTGCIYVLKALYEANGDWYIVFHGQKEKRTDAYVE